MTQISFILAAAITTTPIAANPTTAGPLVLPGWAPDIAAMSTTTVGGHLSIRVSTTGGLDLPLSPGALWNRRCFCLKAGKGLAAGKTMTVDYRSVDDLIRT